MIISLIIIFLIGLCVGSFLNVLIYRLPKEEESVVYGRSRCPHCKKELSWWELVPVLSFMFLRGRCSSCGEKISPQYPLVELATGITFSLLFYKFITIYGLSFTIYEVANLFFGLFIVSVLVVIFMIDLEHYIIPNQLVYTGIGINFGFLVANWLLDLEFSNFLDSNLSFGWWTLSFLPTDLLNLKSLWGGDFLLNRSFSEHILFAIIGAGFFLLLVLLTKGEGMGMGDVKLVFFLGLILGTSLVDVLFFAFWLGALVGLVLIAAKKKSLKSRVPFAPFLVATSLLFVIF